MARRRCLLVPTPDELHDIAAANAKAAQDDERVAQIVTETTGLLDRLRSVRMENNWAPKAQEALRERFG